MFVALKTFQRYHDLFDQARLDVFRSVAYQHSYGQGFETLKLCFYQFLFVISFVTIVIGIFLIELE